MSGETILVADDDRGIRTLDSVLRVKSVFGFDRVVIVSDDFHVNRALFIADPRWKKWVYPHASAIDTPLPVPVETAHIMLDSKCSWAEAPGGKRNRKFHEYPDQSIEDWHRTRGVFVK